MLIGVLVSINLSSCSNEDDEPNSSADAIVDGLAYMVDLDDMSARVVYDRYPTSSYSGVITIPATISINGKNFTVTSIDAGTFTGTSITSVTLPSTISEISGGTFNKCKRLKSITIPASVVFVGGNAFGECSSLTEITLEDSDTELHFSDASVPSFDECPVNKAYIGRSTDIDLHLSTNLKEITLGAEVKKIYNCAFSDNAITIICNGTTPPEISDKGYAPNECYMKSKVYVPSSALQAYKDNEGWSKFWNIEAIK